VDNRRLSTDVAGGHHRDGWRQTIRGSASPSTIKSWSVMETIISVLGLGGVLLLSLVV